MIDHTVPTIFSHVKVGNLFRKVLSTDFSENLMRMQRYVCCNRAVCGTVEQDCVSSRTPIGPIALHNLVERDCVPAALILYCGQPCPQKRWARCALPALLLVARTRMSGVLLYRNRPDCAQLSGISIRKQAGCGTSTAHGLFAVRLLHRCQPDQPGLSILKKSSFKVFYGL